MYTIISNPCLDYLIEKVDPTRSVSDANGLRFRHETYTLVILAVIVIRPLLYSTLVQCADPYYARFPLASIQALLQTYA